MINGAKLKIKLKAVKTRRCTTVRDSEGHMVGLVGLCG